MADWDTVADLLGYPDEAEMLKDMYCTLELSLDEIASKLGSGKATIRRRMDIYGIERRSRGGPNNLSHKRVVLHFLDARMVRNASINDLARLTESHPSTVWKYLKEGVY